MSRLGDALDARRDLLVETVIAEAGCPRGVTEVAQVGMALESIRQLGELYGRMPEWENNEVPLGDHFVGSSVRLSIRRFEPAGVVAAITPYNFPLITNIWKVVPALADRMHGGAATEPAHATGGHRARRGGRGGRLPPGVLNVVPEAGNEGGVLLSPPGRRRVSFTGSTTVGRAIAAQAAPTLKRVILELGGKSVQLHLPDTFADGGLGTVVVSSLTVFASHAGQGCALQTASSFPRTRAPGARRRRPAAAAALPIGDPWIGPTWWAHS